MSDKNIQMKKKNGSVWDSLYPLTLDTNVFNSNGKSVKDQIALLMGMFYFLNDEPIVVGENDWTGRLNRAIIKASADKKAIFLSDPLYTVNGTVWMKSNVTMFSFNNSKLQGANVTEMLKTDSASSYESIKILGIEFDAGKVYQDDNIRVCCQFYNVDKIAILNSKFTHASAGVGFDTCTNILMHHNTMEGMYQQTGSAVQSAGVYGYGVVFNECENAFLHDNFLGLDKDPSLHAGIDRHAVYVSNHGTSNAKNSKRIFVYDNEVVMKDYNIDSDMVTSFEFPFKSVAGDEIYFERNNVRYGAGGVLLSQRNINGGKIVVRDNTFIDCMKVGVWASPDVAGDANANTLSYERLVHTGNLYQLKATFAIAIKYKNIKKIVNKDNTFIATNPDNTQLGACYYMYDVDSLQNEQFESVNNTIKNFLRVARVTNVDHFKCHDIIEDFAGVPYKPFDVINAVNYRDIELKFDGVYYGFKKDSFPELEGVAYYDRDLDRLIKCIQPSPAIWKDSSGRTVVCTSTNRPDIATFPSGVSIWEQDNSRLLYNTGYTWYTGNVILKGYGTKAEILAISNTQLGYSSKPMYNTDDKKPYWYDAYSLKWKDVSGTILV
jgi:hypothetical protein